jgi:hypothetical protein
MNRQPDRAKRSEESKVETGRERIFLMIMGAKPKSLFVACLRACQQAGAKAKTTIAHVY